MSAPNLANPTTINGKTAVLALTTSAAAILSNAAASGKLLKVSSLYFTNVDGTNSADITVNYYTAAALGGTAYKLALTITVAPKATLVLVDRNAPLYLEENTSLGALASASGDIEAVCSYEDIS